MMALVDKLKKLVEWVKLILMQKPFIKEKPMSIFRVILSILFPPLAVIDKGCGSILIVLLLTICGWVPGVIAALIILNNEQKRLA